MVTHSGEGGNPLTKPPTDATLADEIAAGRDMIAIAEAAAVVGLNKKTLYRYYRIGEVYGRPESRERFGRIGKPPLLVDMHDVRRLLERSGAPSRRRPTVEAAQLGMPASVEPPPSP